MHRYSTLRATRHPAAHRSGPGNRSRRRSLFSSRAAVRVSEPAGQVEREGVEERRRRRCGGGGGDDDGSGGISSVNTNTAFTHLSLSVNDKVCARTHGAAATTGIRCIELQHVDQDLFTNKRRCSEEREINLGRKLITSDIYLSSYILFGWLVYFLSCAKTASGKACYMEVCSPNFHR